MKCKCEVKNMIKITKELWHCPVCQSDWQRTKTGIRKLEKKKFITLFEKKGGKDVIR